MTDHFVQWVKENNTGQPIELYDCSGMEAAPAFHWVAAFVQEVEKGIRQDRFRTCETIAMNFDRLVRDFGLDKEGSK